jgi:hypothetical protein
MCIKLVSLHACPIILVSAGYFTVEAGYAPIRLFHLSRCYTTYVLIRAVSALSQLTTKFVWKFPLQERSADPPQSTVQLIQGWRGPQRRAVTATAERVFVLAVGHFRHRDSALWLREGQHCSC